MRKQHKRTDKPMVFTKAGKKGSFNRRVIGEAKDSQREYHLHATKGYRSNRRASEE